jgi:hypothetical protein
MGRQAILRYNPQMGLYCPHGGHVNAMLYRKSPHKVLCNNSSATPALTSRLDCSLLRSQNPICQTRGHHSCPHTDGKTCLQEIIGTLLYYGRAIDSTILVALGSLATAQSTGTKATAQAVTQLLNYCASHPNATVRYHSSQMYLHIHSNTSYLSVMKARSRAGGLLPPEPTAMPPPMNGAVHIHCPIMKPVLSSATEAGTGTLFYNAKVAAPLQIALTKIGHPQDATPLQTNNACALGIVNDTVKQCRSKAMDMRFYWVKDRVAQGQYTVHWRKGTYNLADYFTKHHSPSHHCLIRSGYLVEIHQPIPQKSKHHQDISGKGVLMPPAGVPRACHIRVPETSKLTSTNGN